MMNDEESQIVRDNIPRRAKLDQDLAHLVADVRANPGGATELYALLDEWPIGGTAALDRYSADAHALLHAAADWGMRYVHMQAMDQVLEDLEGEAAE